MFQCCDWQTRHEASAVVQGSLMTQVPSFPGENSQFWPIFVHGKGPVWGGLARVPWSQAATRKTNVRAARCVGIAGGYLASVAPAGPPPLERLRRIAFVLARVDYRDGNGK